MAIPATTTFVIHKGDTRVIRYAIEDALNLTGYKAYWAATPVADLTDKKIEKSTAGDFGDLGGIAISGTNVDVTLASADTDEASTLGVALYACQLHLEDGDGNPVVAAADVMDLKEAIKKLGV